MREKNKERVLALSGGVGGSKLAFGLSKMLPPDQLTILANTGDDFEHLGFTICPDIDSLLYSLSGINNSKLGWGQKGETWNFLSALERLGGETWFKLGDRDLATHIFRAAKLKEGLSLSEVTMLLANGMGASHRILPMTDQPVRTMIQCELGSLSFQNYFVKERCEPKVKDISFEGIESAILNPAALDLIEQGLKAVIICPSNPFLSIDPILSLDGVVNAIKKQGCPVIAVSNIIGGAALKGPAAKLMSELGMAESALGVARYYQERYPGLLTDFVLDQKDKNLENDIATLNLSTSVTQTLMNSSERKKKLAAHILNLASKALSF